MGVAEHSGEKSVAKRLGELGIEDREDGELDADESGDEEIGVVKLGAA